MNLVGCCCACARLLRKKVGFFAALPCAGCSFSMCTRHVSCELAAPGATTENAYEKILSTPPNQMKHELCLLGSRAGREITLYLVRHTNSLKDNTDVFSRLYGSYFYERGCCTGMERCRERLPSVDDDGLLFFGLQSMPLLAHLTNTLYWLQLVMTILCLYSTLP